MKSSSRKLSVYLVGGLAAGSLLLAGCSSNSATSTASSAASAAASAAESAGSAASAASEAASALESGASAAESAPVPRPVARDSAAFCATAPCHGHSPRQGQAADRTVGTGSGWNGRSVEGVVRGNQSLRCRGARQRTRVREDRFHGLHAGIVTAGETGTFVAGAGRCSSQHRPRSPTTLSRSASSYASHEAAPSPKGQRGLVPFMPGSDAEEQAAKPWRAGQHPAHHADWLRCGYGLLLTSVLPLVLGAAVSPLLLTVVIFVQRAGRSRSFALWAFTGGIALVLLALSFVGAKLLPILVADSSKHSPATGFPPGVGARPALLGIRGAAEEDRGSGKLKARIDNASTWEFFVIGMLAMIGNVTSIVLLPALHEIGKSTASDTDKLIVYAMLVVITHPGLVPVLIATVLGPKADPILEAPTGSSQRIPDRSTPPSVSSSRCTWAAGYVQFTPN